MKLGLQVNRFQLAGCAGLHRRHVAGGRPRRRPERARLAVGHGPLLPDLGGRPARARHARGLHDPGARRGRHRADRAGHAGDRGDVPAPRHPAEDRHHARRALRRPGLAGHRRGVERGGAPRPRRALPVDPRAVPAARGHPAAGPPDVRRRRQPVRGGVDQPRAAAEPPAAGAARADHGRRRRESSAPCGSSRSTPTRATCSTPGSGPRASRTSSTSSAGTARTSGATTTRSRRPAWPG